MRILFMAHLAPPRHCAGAEMMVVSMLRPLAARGHQVDMLLSRATPDVEPYDLHGITVHPFVDATQAIEMVPKADLVLAHLENTPRAVVLARMFRRPFGLICHNTHDITRAWCVSDCSLLVYNSQWMADDLVPDHPAAMILRPPVFPDDYRTTPGDRVTLINLNEEKGGRLFWDLARRLPDVPFLAVKGAYGEQIVDELPNVELLEHGGDMRAVYHRTRLLLMPSSYESWGRVGVEAMCSGIPVVANPTPGLLESLGDAGTFVELGDVDGWERTVRRLLQPAVWRKASKAAVARAAELDPAEDLARWIEAVEAFA